jgi:hypothetical protein
VAARLAAAWAARSSLLKPNIPYALLFGCGKCAVSRPCG